MIFTLLPLAITAFAIGMTEFVVIGMLPELAEYFKITIPESGLAVTMYALAVVIAAPFLTALTMNWKRKNLMLAIVGLFTIGNCISAVAPTYFILIIGRILTGFAHGTFFAIATKVAIQLVPKEKQASAIAIMFSGLTVALVVGVPFGTFLAEHVSFRTTFVIIICAGIISFFGILKNVPKNLEEPKSSSFTQQFEFLKNKILIAAFLLTVFSFGGPFIAYTYISNILNLVTGFNLSVITYILVLYGISVAIGNLVGGKLSDKYNIYKIMYLNIIALVVVIILFYFAQHNKLFTVILLFFWGFFSFSIVPILQFLVMKIVSLCKISAEEVASGCNISAFNIGIAGGSFIGGKIIQYLSIELTSLFSAIFLSVSLFIVYYIKNNIKHN
ncbi:MFS transporter [Pigmentibacter sp. JX0631]|uniref:MFS transporter n=1 Tax=Pigmentibacter sp. JX0631 TaxID=2976982 RepID=UPI0024687D77|nr:MFS transporter [Pigmentibacter sp. JX0631]WGL60903.1 MFS transporter [Pigmentibacter sp. JX0631]